MQYVGYVVSVALHVGSFGGMCWIMGRFNEILLGHILCCAAMSIAGWIIGRAVRIVPPDPPESWLFIAVLLLSWAGTAGTVLLWYMVIPAPAEHLYRMLAVAVSLASAAWGIRLTFWSPPDRPAFAPPPVFRTVAETRRMRAAEAAKREAEEWKAWRAFQPLPRPSSPDDIPLDSCAERVRIVDAIFSPRPAPRHRKKEEVIDTVFIAR